MIELLAVCYIYIHFYIHIHIRAMFCVPYACVYEHEMVYAIQRTTNVSTFTNCVPHSDFAVVCQFGRLCYSILFLFYSCHISHNFLNTSLPHYFYFSFIFHYKNVLIRIERFSLSHTMAYTHTHTHTSSAIQLIRNNFV